jgi:uncharacterized membrane protein YhhN
MFLSGAQTIRAQFRASRREEYSFKPLTMVFIILIAVLDGNPLSPTYQVLIIVGLLVSLVGDVFLMLPDDKYFMPGLFSFLVAHILYVVAFTVEMNRTTPIWYIIPFVLYGVIIMRVLWADLDGMRMRIPVLLYLAAILIMAWQAANRWIDGRQDSALLAMIGAYFFIASDSALAIDRFKVAFRTAPFWVLSTYFVAQWLIALSV